MMVGGIFPSLMATAQNTASVAPAAPRRCPTMDLVALTGTWYA